MILNKIKKATDRYFYIGKGIGINDSDLNSIEERYLPDKFRCLHEILKIRIQQGGLMLSCLYDTLKGDLVGREDLAQEIEALALAI